MSYSNYEFGDFRKYYDSGPSDALVGFATGFADAFSKTYSAANAQRVKMEDDLFKMQVQSQLNKEEIAARAKATKTGTSKSDKKDQAATLAGMFPNIPGVEAYIYKGLIGGMTANQIVSDLQTGISDNRLRVTDPSKGTTFNPLENQGVPTNTVTPAPVVPEVNKPVEQPPLQEDETSSVDDQTESMLNDGTPDMRLSSKSVDTPTDTSTDDNFEPYQEASAGEGWVDRYRTKLANNVQTNANARFNQWMIDTGRKSADDVTTASGLTSTKKPKTNKPVTSVAEVKDGKTTSTEAVGAILSIIPKAAKEDGTLDLPKVGEVSNLEEAVVLKSVSESQLNDNPEAPTALAIANKLITDLASVPKLGEMSITDLDVLASTPQGEMGVEYRGIDPALYGKLQEQARTLIFEKRRSQLPSLNFDTASSGRGILADIDSGKYKYVTANLSNQFINDYRTELNNRISALETAEEMAAIKGGDFTLDDYDNLEAQMVIKFGAMADGPSMLDVWKGTEGATLKAIAQRNQERTEAKDVPNDPKQFAIYTLRNSDEFKALDAQKQIQQIRDIEALFNPEQYNLTRSDLAGMLAARRQIVDNPELYTADEVAVAQKWINDIFPTKLASIEATDKPPAPTEIEEQVITYKTADGVIERDFGRIQPDGSVIISSRRDADGKPVVIQKENVVGSTSIDSQDMINKVIAQLPSNVQEAVEQLQKSTEFAVQAKELDDVVKANEEVLQLGGQLQAGFSTFKTQAGSLLKAISTMAMGDDLSGATPDAAKGAITRKLEEMVDSLQTDDATKSAYKQFVSQSILLIFSAGGAVGQSGNGFSNQDFKVLADALTGATTYQDFSNRLRAFAAQGMDRASAKVKGLTISDPRVRNTMTIPGAQEAMKALTLGSQEYLKQAWGDAGVGVFEWSQQRVTSSSTGSQNGTITALQQRIDAGSTTIESIRSALAGTYSEAEINNIVSQLKPKSEGP